MMSYDVEFFPEAVAEPTTDLLLICLTETLLGDALHYHACVGK
jgi:hypothetical protein